MHKIPRASRRPLGNHFYGLYQKMNHSGDTEAPISDEHREMHLMAPEITKGRDMFGVWV